MSKSAHRIQCIAESCDMSSQASLPLLNADINYANSTSRGNLKSGTLYIQGCLCLSLAAVVAIISPITTQSFWMSSITRYPPEYIFHNKSVPGGPFRVLTSTLKVGGYKCRGSQNAIVFYPDDNSHSYPLISFAHGLGAGGHEVFIDYRSFLVGLSSWGFVVIAAESAPKSYCPHIDYDQMRSIDFAMHSRERCFKNVDHKSGVGVAGHSMGGQGTIRSAGSRNHGIAAAVALHPVFTEAAKHVKVRW